MEIYKLSIKKESDNNSEVFYFQGDNVFYENIKGDLEKISVENYSWNMNGGNVFLSKLPKSEFNQIQDKISGII